MAIDPSIISGLKPVQLESPVNALAQMLQVQGAQQQNQLGQMKLDEHSRGIERTNRLQALLAGMKQDAPADEQVGALTRGGYLTEARTLAESSAKVAKEKRESEKFELEGHLKKFEIAGQIMNGVKDQATWERAKAQTAQAFGAEAAAQLPNLYDPALIEQKRAQAMTVKDQLEQVWKQKGYDLDLKQADEVARHNKAGEGLTAAGQAITVRGQNMTDARARETTQQGQYDAERGVVVDKRTGVARPVVAADGKPLQAGSKMTEDQAKATGWLVQAENAWKNMQAVGVGKDGKPTGAAKPGLNDALGTVPGMGAMANTLRTADRQKFVQASSSLSEALLRAATGAGVNRDEAQQKVAELTPQFGESESTTKQKFESIPIYIESLKVRAGPGAAKAANVLKPAAGGVPDDIAALLSKHGGK
jgi:hypothetical protein